MNKMLDISTQLLNIEKHDAVEVSPRGGKYIPVHVVRSLAHGLIVELRKREATDKEVLGYIEKAEQILRELGRIGAEDDS